jgi:hypothetical protein
MTALLSVVIVTTSDLLRGLVFLQEFGAKPEEIFTHFERVPIAAASLAQGILTIMPYGPFGVGVVV